MLQVKGKMIARFFSQVKIQVCTCGRRSSELSDFLVKLSEISGKLSEASQTSGSSGTFGMLDVD